MLQNESLEGCAPGSRVTRGRPTTSCCERTHVCCKVNQTGVAPTQGSKCYKGPTQPGAAASIYMRAAAYSNSGIQSRVNCGRQPAAVGTDVCCRVNRTDTLDTLTQQHLIADPCNISTLWSAKPLMPLIFGCSPTHMCVCVRSQQHLVEQGSQLQLVGQTLVTVDPWVQQLICQSLLPLTLGAGLS